uniref:EF-hand domain-containing protein n=1 Tax=Zooxanthella nutricula TaxID=1333877 RepID=A0A7S2VM52_9DINO
MGFGINALDMANLRIAFSKLDVNGDGTLTLEEMKGGAKALGLDIATLEALFHKMDSDGSGEIDYSEFADHYADWAQEKLRKTFVHLDLDASGTLTLEEMRAGVQELGITEEDVEPLFRKMDEDGSGEVDYAEFANKLLLEMAGGWVGGGLQKPGKLPEERRFAHLGSRALQVYVASLEDLPWREDSQPFKPEVFAVRLRWPSAPFFGECELPGLQAYIWGSEGQRPAGSHGAYVYVDQTARLPWVGGQGGEFVVSVYATDLLLERLVGEIKLGAKLGRVGKVQRFPIRGAGGALQGYAHLQVRCPSTAQRSAHMLFEAPERRAQEVPGRPRPRPQPHVRRPPAAWWSPLALCSDSELRRAESC